jgi:hypothetical protein
MKKITFCVSFILSIIIVVFSSCTKTGPEGPTGAQGSSGASSGTITGHVFLTNQYGVTTDTGFALTGVRAILYNANNNTVLDSINVKSSGIFSFNVSTGIYTVVYRDTNYGQEEDQGFQYVGPGNLEIANKELAHIPNFNIIKVDLDSINHAQSNVIMTDTIAPDTKPRNIAIFFGSTPTASSAPGNYLGVYTYTIAANTNKFTVKIPMVNIYNAGIPSGATAYFAIYGAAYDYTTASEYQDYATGRTIYNALSATAITSLPTTIVMP